MAAFNFPNSPSTNDLHTENGVTYKWNGTVWKRQNASYTDATNLNVTGISTFAGAGTFSSNVEIPSGTLHIGDEIAHYGDTNTNIGFPAADTFTIDTSGSERLRIDSSGRVLIGTSSSRTVWGNHNALQVEGLSGATSSLSIVRNTADQYYPYLSFGKSRGTSDGSSTIVQANDITGVISFNGADGGDMNPQTAYIESAVDGTPGTNDMPGRLSFYTTADGAYSSSERLRITSAGYVGINTTTPSRYLHIVGNDGPSGATSSNSDTQLLLDNTGTNGTHVEFLNANNGSGHIMWTDTDAGNVGRLSYHHNGDYFRFDTSGSERFRINSSGVVSIGGRDPAISAGVGLEISGNATTEIRLKNTAGGWASSDGLAIQKWSNGNTYFWEYDVQHILFGTSNVERLRITSGGLIGVLTSSPYSGIHVKSHTNGWQGGILLEDTDSSGNRHGWNIHPDNNNALMFGRNTNFASNTVSHVMSITDDGTIDTASRTITGGNNLAIQSFRVKSIYSGSGAVGKSIELISGYDSAVKLAAIGYNLTDTTLGSTYGGDLTFHTQPLYSSPTTPLPENMRISSSGYVTKPNVPSFAAYRAQSNWAVSSGETMVFNNTRHNVGSHYSTSNGKFTAPVAGNYLMCFFSIYTGNCNSAYIRMFKNGARQYGSDIHFTHGDNSGQWDNVAYSQVWNLAKGDYITVINGNPGITYHGNHWMQFSGYLLG